MEDLKAGGHFFLNTPCMYVYIYIYICICFTNTHMCVRVCACVPLFRGTAVERPSSEADQKLGWD